MTEHVAPGKPINESPPPLSVSAEEYLERYAHEGYEWVQGRLIRLAAATSQHDDISRYLDQVISAYLALRPIGVLKGDRFVMRLDDVGSFREPDLQVILNESLTNLTPTGMHSASDIVIEIVSRESSSRDHGVKYDEYELAGVREYWIIDPLRNECRFNRLTAEGQYRLIHYPDGTYTTPLLPDLVIDVATLWQDELPNIIDTVESVRMMLGEA